MSVKVTLLTFPGFCANCYLVTDEETKESLLVDPGAYGARQSEYIKSQGIEELKYILLTHGHYDHTTGVRQFKEEFSSQIVIHSEDVQCLHSALKSLGVLHGIKAPGVNADILVADGQTLPFGKGEIEVIHTPGHTKGGVCYKLGDMIFSGDTLFKDNIGRCDFPGSSFKTMLTSLKKLSTLEGDYKVYPGHGMATTLDYERRNNEYMKGR